MKKLFFIVITLLESLLSLAQNDTIDQYYQINFNLDIERFEREHDPLNGKTVKMIPFRSSELFGFAKNGNPKKIIIPPQFEQVYGVYGDNAIVKDTNAGYGLINRKGAYLVPPYFSNLYPEGKVYHGLYYGSADSIYELPENDNSCWVNYYFDVEGELLFTEKAHDFRGFTAGDSLAWFRFGRFFHIRSNTGRLVKSFQIDSLCQFVGISNNTLVYLCDNDTEYGSSYIGYDVLGNKQFQFDIGGWGLDGVFKLSDNFYGLQGGNGDYYFCDSTGEIKPYGSYTYSVGMFYGDARYFDQNHFVLTDEETRKRGIVNRNGKVVAPFVYSELWPLQNGLSFGVLNERQMVNGVLSSSGDDYRLIFVDTFGNETVPKLPPPDEKHYQMLNKTIGFYDNAFLTKIYRKLERIDSNGAIQNYYHPDSTAFAYYSINGEEIVQLSSDIEFAGVFTEGLAPAATTEYKLGFVNKKGNWVVPPIYELQAAGAYPFPYLVVPEFIGGFAYIKAFKGYVDKKGRPYFDGKRMQDRYDFSH